MKTLKQILLAAVMFCMLAAGVFAQNSNKEQKPPQRDPNPVKVGDRSQKPPPPNGNQGDKKGGDDKKGKP